MHRLLLLGLNHSTAPLAVREKLAFNAAQQRKPATPAPRSPTPPMGGAYGGGNRY